MKELSIEEKAKRYDEVIKVAKSNYETIVQMDNDCTFAKEGIVNTFHHMFPELKESEDEKIRKELIRAFNSLNTIKVWNGIERTEILAWLEKQGNKDEEILVLKDQIESLHAAIKAIKKTYRIELEKQGEQKPAWSEKDEDYINDLIKYFSQNEKLENTKEDIIIWLKSLKLKNWWKLSDEQMEALNEVINYAANSDLQHWSSFIYTLLKSLREQLKKLRGE